VTLAPGARLGSYRILESLGAGDIGEIYRARDTRLDRVVAIRVLPRELAEGANLRQRLEVETRAISALSHPNICAILDVGQHEGSHFLVMEHVEGDTIADLLTRRSLDIQRGLMLCLQIAEALRAAHARGILHRSLNPSNIRVTPEGKVKLLDFGLKKLLIVGTRQGTVAGSTSYLSPEQARGREVGKQTDLWSFGCVLYEILSGRRAFGGDNVPATQAAVLERDPEWAALNRSTPEAIRQLLLDCFDKEPSRRLQDAGEAARTIADALAETKEARSRKASRAARLGWWIAVAILILIIVAVAMMLGCRAVVPARVSKLAPLTSTNGIEACAAWSSDGGGSW
jgi:serine/threonine protein kinase